MTLASCKSPLTTTRWLLGRIESAVQFEDVSTRSSRASSSRPRVMLSWREGGVLRLAWARYDYEYQYVRSVRRVGSAAVSQRLFSFD